VKTAVRTSETPRRRSAPGSNERQLVTQHPRRRILSLAASAAVMPAVSKIAIAQTYPTRPITLVIPFAAGGAGTTIARIMVEKIRASLGQPFIIENVPGANGSIGVGRVAFQKAQIEKWWPIIKAAELKRSEPSTRLHLKGGRHAVLPTAPRIAWAQSYPTRPVRGIVPYAAGGPTDIIARLMAQWLSAQLGHQFIIDNRATFSRIARRDLHSLFRIC
jgi:tripartite-type tricarboxylate transporter receptor subunit TctC